MSEDLKGAVKALKTLGITVTGLPTLRATFPKTKLGALIDTYHDVREMRLALAKLAAAVEKHEKAIVAHVVDTVSADEGGAVGKRYKGIVIREQVPIVDDWPALYEHIRKTKSFDLLNKALNRAAAKERLEAGKPVPGLRSMQAKKLSVTKV